MNDHFPDDELTALWRDQPTDFVHTDMKELAMQTRQQHQQEQRRLLFINIREVVPAVVLSGLFGWSGIQATSRAWAFFGAALISLGVGAFLVATSLRQRRRERRLDNTTIGQLERALSQAKHRSWLYRSIAWWYLLPLAAAIVLLLVATERDFTEAVTIIYLAVAAALGAAIYAFNRKVGRDTYDPQVERFSRLIADMN